MASLWAFRFALERALPWGSLSLRTLSTLAWRALRRICLAGSMGASTSRLALRDALGRVVRRACGVVALGGGCGAGVMRRLDERMPLRSAMIVVRGSGGGCGVRAQTRGACVEVEMVAVRVVVPTTIRQHGTIGCTSSRDAPHTWAPGSLGT